jgi:hypothetical protein
VGDDVAEPAGRGEGLSETPVTAVRALMTGAIDYAGLFPPAALAMPDAVERYDRYRRGPYAGLLGRFIIPVARLEEFVGAFTALAVHHAHDDATPWRLSVIAKASDAATLAAFNARYGSRVTIDAIEAPLMRQADVPALGAFGALAATYAVFVEVGSAADPTPLIALLAHHRLRAKIRTGGVTADAFPAAEAVARFILACRDAHVPFKATAGLHHAWRADYPLTYEPGSARAPMYGFVNVLLASAAATGGAGADELVGILSARNGVGVAIDVRGCVLPSGRAVPAALIAAARTVGMASFGSCSFEEPVAELIERGIL